MSASIPEVISVDPPTAQQWLDTIHHQRGLSLGKVVEFAADMEHGRWGTDYMPIVFDADGHLVNGQHRLSAVVLSATTQTFYVIRDAHEDDILYMDKGRPRSVADQLKIHGVAQSANLAPVVKAVVLYHNMSDQIWAGPMVKKHATSTAIEKLGLSNTDKFSECVRLGQLVRSDYRSAPLTSTAAFIYLAGEYSNNLTRLDEFIDGIATGVGLYASDPRLAWRNYMASKRLRWGSYQSDLLGTIKCWNAFVSKRNIRTLRVLRSELPMHKVL